MCVLTIYQRAGPSRQFVIDEISAFTYGVLAAQRELCVLCSVQLCTCVCGMGVSTTERVYILSTVKFVACFLSLLHFRFCSSFSFSCVQLLSFVCFCYLYRYDALCFFGKRVRGPLSLIRSGCFHFSRSDEITYTCELLGRFCYKQ